MTKQTAGTEVKRYVLDWAEIDACGYMAEASAQDNHVVQYVLASAHDAAMVELQRERDELRAQNMVFNDVAVDREQHIQKIEAARDAALRQSESLSMHADSMRDERDAALADARRLDWLLTRLQDTRINGEVTYYSLAHALHVLRGCTNKKMMAAAIDSAMAAPTLPRSET